MFKKAALVAIAVAIAAPASANDALARMLKVEPGVYTSAELTQMIGTSGPSRKVRLELIQKQREAFDRAVQASAARLGGVVSTRTVGQ